MMDQDRLKHCLAVANKMVEIGKLKSCNDEELKELFVLGFNHDIGYAFDTGVNHNEVGYNMLKKCDYKYSNEVLYHGKPDCSYKSFYLDILNCADMMIDKYGNDVGFDKRLEDIKSRYGESSIPYQNCLKLVDKLKMFIRG